MRRFSIVALVALTCAAFTADASAARIGKASASGAHAVAIATGTAGHPGTLRVTVSAKPSQRVSVTWTIVCTKGGRAGTASGSAKGSSTLRRTLRKPMSRPDACTVSATGKLAGGSGRIRVSLFAS
jgi:hypothetical protein